MPTDSNHSEYPEQRPRGLYESAGPLTVSFIDRETGETKAREDHEAGEQIAADMFAEACRGYAAAIARGGRWEPITIPFTVAVQVDQLIDQAADQVRKEIASGAFIAAPRRKRADRSDPRRNTLTPGTEHLTPKMRGNIRQYRNRLRESRGILLQARAKGDEFAIPEAVRWVAERERNLLQLLKDYGVPPEPVLALDAVELETERNPAASLTRLMLAEARDEMLRRMGVGPTAVRAGVARVTLKLDTEQQLTEEQVAEKFEDRLRAEAGDVLRTLAKRGPRKIRTAQAYIRPTSPETVERLAAAAEDAADTERWVKSRQGREAFRAWAAACEEARKLREAAGAARLARGLPPFNFYVPGPAHEARVRAHLGLPPLTDAASQ